MSGYIGTQPVPQSVQHREAFTATSGQTSFATAGYTPQFLDVYLNGIHLVNGDDYTATNGSDVVLTTGAATDDVLEVVSYTPFEVADQTFTGTTTVVDLQATTADFSGAVTGTNLTLSGGVYLGGTGAANLLDDYEEGTWTPVIRGQSNAGSYSLGIAVGSYTKIGRMVYLSVRIVVGTVITAGTGYMQITGLPFVKNSNSILNDSAVRLRNTTGVSSYDWATLEMITGSATDVAYIFCNQVNSGGFDMPVSGVQAGTEISGHIFFETA